MKCNEIRCLYDLRMKIYNNIILYLNREIIKLFTKTYNQYIICYNTFQNKQYSNIRNKKVLFRISHIFIK